MSLIKKFWNAILNKEQQPFIVGEKEIPFHIKEIGKLYPIVHTVVNNQSIGEIKYFDFANHENSLRVGQGLIINEKKGMQSIWVHLGNDFFKNVVKA